MLTEWSGPIAPMCEGDIPPGSLPWLGEAGMGNLWSAALGEGAGNLLSWDEGVWGVAGPVSPHCASLVGVLGPGYLGGSWPEPGVWGPGVPGPLLSGAGVLGSPPTLK